MHRTGRIECCKRVKESIVRALASADPRTRNEWGWLQRLSKLCAIQLDSGATISTTAFSPRGVLEHRDSCWVREIQVQRQALTTIRPPAITPRRDMPITRHAICQLSLRKWVWSVAARCQTWYRAHNHPRQDLTKLVGRNNEVNRLPRSRGHAVGVLLSLI